MPGRAGDPRVAARGRFGLGDAIILGLSSSGPAQTLAVSLAGMIAACRYGGVIPVLICFVPMLGIAVGYQRLNRWDPNSGATFTWVARVFHPYLGFLAGWMILIYYTLGTSSLTIPAGTYTLQLLAPDQVDNHVAVAIVGGLWNVAVTLLALKGLKVAARFEWVVVVFQYLVLLLVAIAGIAALFSAGSAAVFSWDWFTLNGLGGVRGLMSGLLIACFMYSGWDASVYVNEEAADQANSPGLAAIASVTMLALFYSISLFGLQAVLPSDQLQSHAGNALALIAERLLPGPWGLIMSLVVLAGTLATLQAAVISAARVGLAMAREGVMPRMFRRVSPATGNPWVATLVMSAVNIALLALALGTNNISRALENIVSSLGLVSILFYGLTGAAAVWHNRRTLGRSWSDLLLSGALPGAGTLFMAWVAIESVRSGATSSEVLAYGIGSIVVGILISVSIRIFGRTRFFQQPLATTAGNPTLPREQIP